MDRYSFIGHPYGIIMQQLVELFPFIEKVDAIYFMDHLPVFKTFHANAIEIADIRLEAESKPAVMRLVNKWRQSDPVRFWCRREELPFYYFQSSAEERDLFSDEESNTLVLKLKNKEDGFLDLLFIYLRQEPGKMGLTRSDHPVSLEQKSVISTMLDHLVRFLLEKIKKDQELFNLLNENTRSILESYQDKETEILKLKSQYGSSLVKYCENKLRQISTASECEYVLDDSALEKIRSFTGDFSKLDRVIEEAVIFISSIFQGQHSDQILIHGYYLNFDKVEVPAVPVKSDRPRIDSKESRASDLLDKLERAALVVKQKNLSFTSANVGKMMPTSISAPAISDALKKNDKKVEELLRRYPDRWKTIREQFRPVINLLNKSGGRRRLDDAG